MNGMDVIIGCLILSTILAFLMKLDLAEQDRREAWLESGSLKQYKPLRHGGKAIPKALPWPSPPIKISRQIDRQPYPKPQLSSRKVTTQEATMFGAADEYDREMKEYHRQKSLIVAPVIIPKRQEPKCCQWCTSAIRDGKCTECGGPNAKL